MKSRCNSLACKIKKDPYNRQLVDEFYRIKKSYKALIKKNKRKFEENIWAQLEHLERRNPTEYWKLFNDLKNVDKAHKQNEISMNDWINHFSSLLNKSATSDPIRNQSMAEYIGSTGSLIFNELNYRMSEPKIMAAAFSLKRKKTSGTDGIINEMIKSGILTLKSTLTQLFNSIFSLGHYPNNWRTNSLSPLHKKGDQKSCDNFRGIAVGCCLSKLFLSVLNKRLITFVNNQSIIPKHQIGYQAKCQTLDHILTLKNMVDKYIHRASRKYLFVCFVDFKAAFDSVWRLALFYKLAHLNIGGYFLQIIQSMYSNVAYSIKVDGELSEPFNSSTGLKQGCVLSPMLFNLFLSDFPDVFDHSCHPVSLTGQPLNCLMFADDIVLMSESAEGLQQCLDKLHTYTKQWNLTVNTSKTKVIIFNKDGHRITRHNFTLNGTNIEIVQNYTYLGILFSSSGSFNPAIKALYDKALKSFFKLKQVNPRNNVLMALKLFDMLVTPILTYGSCVWGPTLVKKIQHQFQKHMRLPSV